MRRKFVYDPEVGDLVEVGENAPVASVAPVVFGDLKPVQMPGGPVITDRGAYRRYLKANDLIPHEDAKGVAARVRAEKARAEAAARKRAVIDAYEHTRNQERARKRYG
jgi:hypothetical protein